MKSNKNDKKEHSSRQDNLKSRIIELIPQRLRITAICSELKIDRSTYYRWLNDDPEFKRGVEEAKNHRNDFVEDMLMMAIFDGDSSAIRFYLNKRHPDYKDIPPETLQNAQNDVLEASESMNDKELLNQIVDMVNQFIKLGEMGIEGDKLTLLNK
ncbi:MAG: phBC6A51 family helix-turn-helix protein [Patescibacteria group bacterium]|nr:phBC6A51 family helix-turn-helix protein [Patescibacteria group bacterium]